MMLSAEQDKGPLERLAGVRKRFKRSVHLPRDWSVPHEPADYVTTPTTLDLAGQVLGELGRQGGTRAWTFTGPFGTGKSAFALFLTDLLAGVQPLHPGAVDLHSTYLNGSNPLVPLLVQADRCPIEQSILNCMIENRSVASRYRHTARKLSQKTGVPGGPVADLLVSAAESTQGGLVLIVDELGKYLEYAARTPTEDIFILQQLAEAATRSEKPFLFIGILHSGFGEYASSTGNARRSEWQKVQGRFQDLPFVFPYEQFLDLLGSALCPNLDKPYIERFERIVGVPALREICSHQRLRSRLLDCLPIHPVAALVLWPLFRGKASQNERSLFSFLTSYEPHGFQHVLDRELNSDRETPLYGLSSLYDYISTSLGLSAFTGQDSRRWGLVNRALERVPKSAPLIAWELVKAIGLLSMYGDTANIRPDAGMLHAVFDDMRVDEIDEALALLEQESIVVFRKHKGGYGLWEGSDLDLDAAFQIARGHCGGGFLHRRILESGRPRPIVARAHYVKTGTQRFFEVRLSSTSDDSLASAIFEPTQADGIVVFVVDVDLRATDADRTLRAISKADGAEKPILLAAPHSLDLLNKCLEELECWEWISENVPELDGDSVARQEVRARAMNARIRFEHVAGSKFGLLGHVLDPSLSAWYFGGRRCKPFPKRPRDLQILLSRIFDKAYARAPRLRNELLNRLELSATAARARRNLLEHVVRDGNKARLGIDGFPPEYSMYQSLLVEGGFHRVNKGKYFVGAPPQRGGVGHYSVWSAIERFIGGARKEQRSVAELYNSLKAPPFGLREGPISVILSVALIADKDKLALYEDDLFVPDIGIETLERLVRRPETFSIRSFQLDKKEQDVVAALKKLERRFSTPASLEFGSDRGSVIGVVKSFVHLAESLPPFSQKTLHLVPKSAQKVRDVLRAAVDPHALLFDDLPSVLGIDLNSKNGATRFANALIESANELLAAYPKMLDELEECIGVAFNIAGQGKEMREELRHRMVPLLNVSGDSKLNLFLKIATRDPRTNGEDWREAIGRVVVGGKPPSHWHDNDLEMCKSSLRGLAAHCDTLSELVAASSGDSFATVASIGLMEPGIGERKIVVACSDRNRMPVEGLTEELLKASSRSGLDQRSQLIALVLAAKSLVPTSSGLAEVKTRKTQT